MLQQGSTHRRRWLRRATRSARLLRSASAAFASVASIVATNASATLPTLGLMIRWPEFCCQKSPTITCKSNKLDCWPVWCTPCAQNFPMVQPSIVYWISQNLTQSNLMYPNIQYVTHSIKREIFISV